MISVYKVQLLIFDFIEDRLIYWHFRSFKITESTALVRLPRPMPEFPFLEVACPEEKSHNNCDTKWLSSVLVSHPITCVNSSQLCFNHMLADVFRLRDCADWCNMLWLFVSHSLVALFSLTLPSASENAPWARNRQNSRQQLAWVLLGNHLWEIYCVGVDDF